MTVHITGITVSLILPLGRHYQHFEATRKSLTEFIIATERCEFYQYRDSYVPIFEFP